MDDTGRSECPTVPFWVMSRNYLRGMLTLFPLLVFALPWLNIAGHPVPLSVLEFRLDSCFALFLG